MKIIIIIIIIIIISWPLATSCSWSKRNISTLRTACAKAIKGHNNKNKKLKLFHFDNFALTMTILPRKLVPQIVYFSLKIYFVLASRIDLLPLTEQVGFP